MHIVKHYRDTDCIWLAMSVGAAASMFARMVQRQIER